MEEKKYFISIQKKKIEVSKEVYETYYQSKRKERYFTYDLKAEQTKIDLDKQLITSLPSREDSYERLLEADHQFASKENSPEEKVLQSFLRKELEHAMNTLSQEEQSLIQALFFQNKTEQEISDNLEVAQTTISYRKKGYYKNYMNF